MIPNVLLSIATALHQQYHDAKIYFNPARQVSGNSFLVNLLNYSIEKEQHEIFRHRFNWDIGYVPKIVQTPPNVSYGTDVPDQRIYQGGEVIQQLFYVLDFVIVKGFYNINTKEEDIEEPVPTFERRVSLIGDIFHYYFSLEFRTRAVNQEDLIKSWKMVTEVIQEINS